MNNPYGTVTCPNCGAQRPAGIPYCSNCGYGMPGRGPTRPSPVVWIILFVLIGLPAGCLGGCFLLLSSGGSEVSWALLGLAGIAVFVLLLVMLIRKSRR